MADDEKPKIQIDSDWKAQAQAEKQRLAEKSKSAPSPAGGTQTGAAGAAGGEFPPASFETLLEALARPAIYAMGGIQDPRTGQRVAHLPLARHHIDLLGILEEKTKGNITEEQSNLLASTMYQLRSTYIQLAQRAR
jgi:hypothetical protein